MPFHPSVDEFILQMPKAELHVHLEGTLEPELMVLIANRNGMQTWQNAQEIKESRAVNNYESFWKSYQLATEVLQTQQDFYDVTLAYLQKMSFQGVRHVEITFDLDTYLPRGIHPETIINGIHQALQDGKKQFDISGLMILCFLRHLPVETALKTFKKALPYKSKIGAIGLASFEKGNPPSNYVPLFDLARQHGFFTTAHSGENAGSEYIWQTIDLLKVDRIDHGVRCLEDAKLVDQLRTLQIPITVCPLSNIKTGVFASMQEHPLRKMLEVGLNVSINSDDPAFFDGYINDNYKAASQVGGLTIEEIIRCARNSFLGSFASEHEKKVHLEQLNNYWIAFKQNGGQ